MSRPVDQVPRHRPSGAPSVWQSFFQDLGLTEELSSAGKDFCRQYLSDLWVNGLVLDKNAINDPLDVVNYSNYEAVKNDGQGYISQDPTLREVQKLLTDPNYRPASTSTSAAPATSSKAAGKKPLTESRSSGNRDSRPNPVDDLAANMGGLRVADPNNDGRSSRRRDEGSDGERRRREKDKENRWPEGHVDQYNRYVLSDGSGYYDLNNGNRFVSSSEYRR